MLCSGVQRESLSAETARGFREREGGREGGEERGLVSAEESCRESRGERMSGEPFPCDGVSVYSVDFRPALMSPLSCTGLPSKKIW